MRPGCIKSRLFLVQANAATPKGAWKRTLYRAELAPYNETRVPGSTEPGRAFPRGTENKVLAIMDYEILRKQAYRGTGGERGSRVGVTDSLQKEGRLAANRPVGRVFGDSLN